MKISNNCGLVVMHFERFMSHPYLCPAGKPTIGYGSRFYKNGKEVSLNDAPISEPVAKDLMNWELGNKSTAINIFLKAEVNQAQYDSLVSFGYNVGVEQKGLKGSTLMRLINEGVLKQPDWKRIVTVEFAKWKYSAGVITPGLVSRRSTEAWLFCEGIIKYFNQPK